MSFEIRPADLDALLKEIDESGCEYPEVIERAKVVAALVVEHEMAHPTHVFSAPTCEIAFCWGGLGNHVSASYRVYKLPTTEFVSINQPHLPTIGWGIPWIKQPGNVQCLEHTQEMRATSIKKLKRHIVDGEVSW